MTGVRVVWEKELTREMMLGYLVELRVLKSCLVTRV